MNKKAIQITALIAFVVVAIAALYYGMNGETTSNEPVANTDPQTVHILKYSDYQCPACKSYIPVQEQLEREYGELVQFEYRYFPLDNHQFAYLAASAAEAARKQGEFEEMHDMIFDNQEVWSRGGARDHFMDYAEELGLDLEQFESDMDSDEVRRTVESQKQEGIRRTVNSTPTYFINGQKLRQNPQSYEQFKSIIELYMYRSS